METNFEPISGISLGFEIVTEPEAIGDDASYVIIIDLLIFRLVVTKYDN